MISSFTWLGKLALSALLAALIHRVLVASSRRGPQLRGPPKPASWLLGHEVQLLQQTTGGELERQWTEEYGTATRISSFAGQTAFLISDPRAIQYVMNEKVDDFPKGGDNDLFGLALMGRGLAAVSGRTHQRQRRILTPAYSTSMASSWAALFQDHGAKMMERIQSQAEENPTVNILTWTTRFALDVLGLSGFRHEFGAIDGVEVPVTKELQNAFHVAATSLTVFDLIVAMAAIRLPKWTTKWLAMAPTPVYRALNKYKRFSQETAAEVMHSALNSPKEREQKDVTGLLASSFHSSDPADKLQMDEVLAQMSTFLVAGQETTANSQAVLMYMLATHPADQQRLREEVQAMYVDKPTGEPLEPKDFDKLPILNAVIKESLRLYTSVHALTRHVGGDNIIPLAFPVTLDDGSETTSVPVQRGNRLLVSFQMYNKLPAVWGDDAAEWNPNRFLDGRQIHSNVGLFGNVMNFSAGSRGCLGWRFAVMEMQVVTALLVKTFDITIASGTKIKMLPNQFVLMPVVEGRESEGTQVPLQLRAIN